jgi:hypothetical protein
VSALTLYSTPGKMTRRLAAVVIGSQGLAVFFGALVARAVSAAGGSHSSATFLLSGSLLAAICILDAGLLRRPWGITLGWVLQVVILACALVVPAMVLVELIFGALWLTALVQGHAMDLHTMAVDEQWHAAHGTSAADEAAGSGSTATGSSAAGSSAAGSSTAGSSAGESPAVGSSAGGSLTAGSSAGESPAARSSAQEADARDASARETSRPEGSLPDG